MRWPAILLVVLGLFGPGSIEPDPTPPTSIPESPAGALSLEPDPAPPRHPPDLPPPLPGRMPALPFSGPSLAALAAGFALLAARVRRASAATGHIRASLQDSFFSDVGHGDLTTVAETLRSLDPMEATAAVAGLSDHELGVWMRELDGWVGGFSSSEQDRLFSQMAAQLAPAQLARVAAHGRTGQLVEAARTFSPPPARAELAMLLWSSRTPTDDGWEQIGSLLEAVPAVVLARAIDRESAGALAFHLFGHHASHRDERPRIRLDALPGFLAVVETVGDAELRADIFLAVAGELTATEEVRVTGPGDRESVLGALASLLRTDPAATVSELNHRSDPHANVLSGWIKMMISSDRLDELDVLLADLLGGDDRLGHFTDRGPDPADPYPHASNLGYYAGAYGLAIDTVADDAEDRITLVAQLFSIVTGVVPSDGGGGVRLPVGPLVDRHAAAIVAGLRDEATGLKQTLWGLAKPRDEDGSLWNGEGTTQFQDAWEEVMVGR